MCQGSGCCLSGGQISCCIVLYCIVLHCIHVAGPAKCTRDLDVVFLVDRSARTNNLYPKYLRGIKKALKLFDVHDSRTNFAMVHFNEKAHVVTKLGENNNEKIIWNFLQKGMPDRTGKIDLAEAFKVCVIFINLKINATIRMTHFHW